MDPGAPDATPEWLRDFAGVNTRERINGGQWSVRDVGVQWTNASSTEVYKTRYVGLPLPIVAVILWIPMIWDAHPPPQKSPAARVRGGGTSRGGYPFGGACSRPVKPCFST